MTITYRKKIFKCEISLKLVKYGVSPGKLNNDTLF